LLALLVAPLVVVLAGRGLGGLAEAAAAARPDAFITSTAAAALCLSGLMYATLVMVRFSPVGPFLAGLGYLAVGIWALADPAGFDAALQPDLVSSVDLDAELVTAAEVAPLLAVPLILTVFSGKRWGGRHAQPAGYYWFGPVLDWRRPDEPTLVMEPVTSPATPAAPPPATLAPPPATLAPPPATLAPPPATLAPEPEPGDRP
jgi:hypothetical protein